MARLYCIGDLHGLFVTVPDVAGAMLPELALKDHLKKEVIRQSSFKANSQGRIAAWVLDTAGFEQCNKSKIIIIMLFVFCC